MVSNLVHTSDNDTKTICRLLQERFKQDKPYTQLGHRCLVVVNPFKVLELLNDASLQHYANQGYKDLLANADAFATLEPHVYDLATQAYLVMRRRGEDQTIMLSGVSGSGKSSTHRHLLSELLLLSTHTRREEKRARQIQGATTILEAFGTAATRSNDTASQHSVVHTLWFDDRGHVAGAHLHLLNVNHTIVTSTTGNVQVLYQLLAGTTPDEKRAFHIDHPLDFFAYVRQGPGRSSDKDAIAFGDLKEALKTCGFKAKTVAQMCQLLAAILHLGNVQFVGAGRSTTSAHSSGVGNGSGGGQESCKIKNMDMLSLVAAALGVATAKLESTLTHRLKLIGKEFCTAFLTVDAAVHHRDALAHALYYALVLWIIEQINNTLIPRSGQQVIRLVDAMSHTMDSSDPGIFYDLCVHFTTERLQQYVHHHHFGPVAWHDDVDHAPTTPALATTSALSLFVGSPTAIVPSMTRESQRFAAYALDATDARWLSTLQHKMGEGGGCLKPATHAKANFAIQYYTTTMEYTVDGFLETNLGSLSPDFVHLFRYNCTNTFLHDLFHDTFIITETHPRDDRTVIKAQLPACSKAPQSDMAGHQEKKPSPSLASVLDQIDRQTSDLVDQLASAGLFEIIHLRPNLSGQPDVFDAAVVTRQLEECHISNYITRMARAEPMYSYTHQEFVQRYRYLVNALPLEADTDGDRIAHIIEMLQWTNLVHLGTTRVWLPFDVWRNLEQHLRVAEKDARVREKERQAALEAARQARQAANEAARQAALAEEAEAALAAAEAEAAALAAAEAEAATAASAALHNPFDDDGNGHNDDDDGYGSQRGSDWDDEEGNDDDDDELLADVFGPNTDMSKMVQDYDVQPEVHIEEVPITRIRRYWARFVWFCTWWIPSFLLRWCGKMQRQDVQIAWREKVTLCMLIFSLSAMIIFVIVGLGKVICPGTDSVFSAQDITNHATMSDYWVSVRGRVYDVSKFAAVDHGTPIYAAGPGAMKLLAGRDLSYTFPPPLTVACAGLVQDSSIAVTPNETILLGPFVHLSGDQQPDLSLANMRDPMWIKDQFIPTMQHYRKGDLVVPMKQIEGDFNGWGRMIAVIHGKVYDLTDYMATARRYPIHSAGVPNYHYLDEQVESYFLHYGGQDASADWDRLMARLDPEARQQNQACLDNVFYIGRLDYRETIRCTFVNYLLLSFAVLMSTIILVKFLAALQFGSAPTPEEHDKFVICQVPCYTEGEESLRKTIGSLTATTYDDRRKLLFVIADGMIIGRGNDRPTPHILLDILGHDTDHDDPEPLMFKSIGEGSQQLNFAKVYSGLYQHEGHIVPYVVVVKVGKSTEHNKPGNRGKRDSQMICMSFLNRVHFDSTMSPLELEIYYQMKHVIGVDPRLYEYVLMIDSDTEVYPDAINRLVSCMLHDSRVIGLCGETELCNEDRSWATMIQVYEYYISHHLVKAFESLFGSVTCLPGCFCMYRIRTTHGRKPLIVSPAVIHDYSDNQVDTLHKKNLLHLGEDRYLTTLMMKHFPEYKMMFTPFAKCRTAAPDQWRVLLSQRRRWINSTIHNLFELLLLPELCGFCCLSMRFVVIADLIGTITLPSSVIYLGYLIWEALSHTGPLPVIALGMLSGAYGLQAVIFIAKRQWQHIGWMVIYLLAIPIFSFFIPLYAFWHFDDFSWGNTRVVVGDKKKQIIVTDEKHFDEKMIPLKRWTQYEQELYDESDVSYPAPPRRYCTPRPQDESNDQEESLSRASFSSSRTPPPTDTEPAVLLPTVEGETPSPFSVDITTVIAQRHFLDPATDHDDPSATVIPENDVLERDIERILAHADLMTLTKKQVRDQLSRTYGVDLTIKKGFISAAIERCLARRHDNASQYNAMANDR